MTTIDEMKERGAAVLVGDDVNKASWRFEREGIGMPLEASEAWTVLAHRNNILDPFQTAQSDNPKQQWVKPRRTIGVTVKNIQKTGLIVPKRSILSISSYYLENGGTYIDGKDLLVDRDIIIERDYSIIKIEFINDIYIEISSKMKEGLSVYSEIKVDKFAFAARQMQINGMSDVPTAGNVLTTGTLGWSLK